MSIRLSTDQDQSAWDEYVRNHPCGLAYHQYAWKKAIEEAYGFEGLYLMGESQGQITGVLPLIDFKVPFLGRALISLPYCDVGGILADQTQIETALMSEALHLSRKKRAKRLEFRTVAKSEEPGLSDDIKKVRMILDLPASSEALLAGMKSKRRSQINKPLRDGLSCRLGGPELLEDFYPIFSENMRDLGSPVHSKKWFQAIVKAYGARSRVGLVLTRDGVPAGGGVILLNGKTISIPWASCLRKYNHLNPNMLLYYSFLSFAADNHFTTFDFGRSTPGEGTYRFKAQWGAQPQALIWQEIDNDGAIAQTASANSNLRQSVGKFWSSLPLALCNALGPMLRRNISL